MTPERWQQIDQLFQAVLERGPGQRAAFLAQACVGDESLRLEVESLIESHEQSDSFIDKPADDIAAELLTGAQTRLSPGQRIGHYTITAFLGAGGMGEVYLAQDLKLGRQIALKLLPALFTVDGTRVRRFEQEARAASALNHPNIVTIHEIGRSNSAHFIATEFIDGETLHASLAGRAVKLNKALDIATQVASALAAAHGAGIVHRDIKPENIMLRRDRIVKVLDFGLAKLTLPQVAAVDPEAPTKSMVKTDPGVVMGTVQYMSPEQARGLDVDARTDIWSLGCVLYEMVTGNVPFGGETPSHVIVSILESEPPPLARYSEVPAELERIVTKALRKERQERYQAASDLALDLKSLKQELEVEARLKRAVQPDADGRFKATNSGRQVKTVPESAARTADIVAAPPTSSAEYLVGEIKRHRRAAALVGAALVVAVAAVAYFFYFARSGSDAVGLQERPLGEGNPVRIQSLAVLPMENLSGDPAQEYFADGITEALINELAKVGAVRVISRTSVMQYKGARKTTPEIARELNVDAVVAGSVLRSNERVRVTAQLIRAATDQHLWAESYERDLRDVLTLQSEIARAIAGEIRIKLTPQEQVRLTSTRPINPMAHEAYLKGLYYFNQGINSTDIQETEDLHRKSFDYFEQSIKLEPDYALAYADLARSYHWLASSGFPQFYPKAKEAALKALAIDDTLAEAHGALAFTVWIHDWDWARAEREFKRTIELNPSLGNVGQHAYALFLSAMGRHDEAIREIKLAQELDPLILPLKVNMGWIYDNARQYDQAIAQFQSILELNPDHADAHSGLGAAYIHKGMYEEGIAECQRAVDLSRDMPAKQANLAWAYAMAGRRSEARKILDELKDLPQQKLVRPGKMSVLYAALGERDQALTQLKKAYADREAVILDLKVSAEFDSLRSDPRFTDLLRRVNLLP